MLSLVITYFIDEDGSLKRDTIIDSVVGKTFNSNNFGKFTVIKYEHSTKVHIQFEATGGINVADMSHVRSGSVADLLAKTTYDIGYIGYNYDCKCKDSKKLFKIWSGLVQRCFDPLWKTRHKCYELTTCSEDFLCAANFITWSKSQIGYNSIDESGKPFALDKDILLKGNTVYSPDTCVFVPREINNLILSNRKVRGNLPIGVTSAEVRFRARVSINNKEVALGVFETSNEAFQAYKEAKERHIKEVANKWKDRIDQRVYYALMKYEIDITD